jgi:hypothetical protein
LEENLVEKNPPSFLYLSITEHKANVLDRSDILNIGNKNIVLYRIEFMPAIHGPNYRLLGSDPMYYLWYQICQNK